MDRTPRRWLALVRALLVALGLSLMGAEPIAQVITVNEVHSPEAHAHGVGLPDPDPVVAGERDEEPRGPSEDDQLAHGPGAHLIVLGPDARRVQMSRGPPGARARGDLAPSQLSWPPGAGLAVP